VRERLRAGGGFCSHVEVWLPRPWCLLYLSMAGRTIRRVGACRSLVNNKEQPIADYTISPHERRESAQSSRGWGECVLVRFKAEDVLGEGKRRVTIASARPRNNWGFETHHRSLLSNCQPI
jgi:hypothetical protein